MTTINTIILFIFNFLNQKSQAVTKRNLLPDPDFILYKVGMLPTLC